MLPNNQEYHSQSVHKKLNLAGRMAQLFVKNRELNVLSILFIIVWGIISFIIMPKAYNPEIVAPAFIITTDFPGATAQQVQDLITRPMEDVVSELPGIDKVISHSFDGGQSVVMLQFEVGTPAENAKISLSQKLRENMYQKPINAGDPTVETMDPDDVPVISIALTSGERSPEALRVLAFRMVEQLKLVPGTSKLSVAGGRIDNLQIELDAEKIAQYHLSVSDIIGLLQGANGIYTAEKIKGAEATAILRVNGSLGSPDEFGKIVVSPNRDKPIFLSDVATIIEGPGEIIDSVKLSRKDAAPVAAAYVSVAKLKGANITDVTTAIRSQLSEIGKQKEFSAVNFSVMRDDGEVAHEEIFTLTKHLVISILIVVVILMAFLGLRNSLIVAIAIPLTLLASFGVGLLAGQTINRITLFALILALGLLVDDAIVIIENIHRTIKNNPGQNKGALIIQAVDEVGMGVFMSTITILLAFIPMAFVTGMMGPYMAPIPFFVSTTLLISLFIAFTVNPALTGIFTTHSTEGKENIFVRSIHKIEDRYARLIGILVVDRKKKKMVLGFAGILLLIALSLPALKIVQFRMLPKANKNQFYAYLDLPAGTTYRRTEALAEKVEKITLETPEVESVESFVGTAPISDFNGLFKGSFMRAQENQATLKINLTPHTERQKKSEEIALGLRDILLDKILAGEPDAKLVVVEDPPGPPVRSTFFLKIQGADQMLLDATAKDLENMARDIPGIVDLKTSISERSAEKQFAVDVEKAGRFGIAPASIMQTLHMALTGANIARYSENPSLSQEEHEQRYVFLRLQLDERNDLNDLSRITVTGMNGQAIPISELLVEKPLAKKSEIATDQRQETVYVSAEMGTRSVIYAVLDLFPKLFDYRLADGTGRLADWSLFGFDYQNPAGQTVSVRLDGEWKLTLEIFRDLGMAMGIALLMIYFVLVAQLKSLVAPLLIMATIPLALIGVLFGFAILGMAKGTFFNATSMIGVIALAGIVVKNAIIYLAYLDELKEKGMALGAALQEAGRVRLLPILLTSLTAILGSLTIIADPVWEGLAWAIIFGLSVSTILTLVIFPLLYQTFEGKKWEKRGED